MKLLAKGLIFRFLNAGGDKGFSLLKSVLRALTTQPLPNAEVRTE
jgi:hypothetical protein